MNQPEKPLDPQYLSWCEAVLAGSIAPFMENMLVIRDERERYVPFIRNGIQAHYAGARSIRDVLAKPRKIGFTTDWLAEQFTLAITTEGHQALATTYDDEEAEYMFGIVRRFYEQITPARRPKLGKDTGRAMSFPNLDSSIEIQTAGGRRKGRGRTPSAVLIDEFAQYDEAAADEILTSMLGSLPTWVPLRVQSTPKGIGNPFHRLYVDARQGTSPFKAHFYPWMWMPEKHRLAADDQAVLSSPLDAVKGALELDDEERDFVAAWNGLHPLLPIGEDNIRWRRFNQRGFRDTFLQEFPEDEVTCFLATSDTVFDTKRIAPLAQQCRQPVETSLNGKIKVWKRPRPAVRYYAGVDCGEGIAGRDNSAAVIGDGHGEVSVVVAGILNQVEMAQVMYDLLHQYNSAFILNERQAAYTFQLTLWNMGYRNIYRHKEIGRRPGSYQPQLGWPSSTAAKQRIIETMRSALMGDAFSCQDIETIREVLEFKRHKDGTYGAPAGCHDDRAIAAMLYLIAIQEGPSYNTIARAVTMQKSVVPYPEGVFS